MFKGFVQYPSFSEEFEIARRTTAVQHDELKPVLTGEQILELQQLVRKVPVTDHIIKYTLALVRQTRIGEAPRTPSSVKPERIWTTSSRVRFSAIRPSAWWYLKVGSPPTISRIRSSGDFAIAA